jgi:membrane protein implicated in regulation of membrane protease activity
MQLLFITPVEKEVVTLCAATVLSLTIIIAGAFFISSWVRAHAPRGLLDKAPLLTVTVPIVGLALLVCALLVATIIYAHKQEEREHWLKLTMEARAIVGESTYHKDTRNTVVRYRYVVSGMTYPGVGVLDGDVHQGFREGQGARACYDPADPSDSMPALGDAQCGQPLK